MEGFDSVSNNSMMDGCVDGPFSRWMKGFFMKFLIGKKLNMTQMFASDGKLVPLTLIQVFPNRVVGHRTSEKDGYSAVIVGSERKKATKANKAQIKIAKDGSVPRVITEFRVPVEEAKTFEVDSTIDSSAFEIGANVTIVGTSKGKGFAGVVKRHHFHGHPTSHGHKDQERMPGSISAGGMQHVTKGRKMAGRMGSDRVTIKGLKVVSIDTEKGVIGVSGAIPGARNSMIILKSV